MEKHLWEELDWPGQRWSSSDQDCTLCLLHKRPYELGPLGAVGLQGVALITDHNPKAAEKHTPLVNDGHALLL